MSKTHVRRRRPARLLVAAAALAFLGALGAHVASRASFGPVPDPDPVDAARWERAVLPVLAELDAAPVRRPWLGRDSRSTPCDLTGNGRPQASKSWHRPSGAAADRTTQRDELVRWLLGRGWRPASRPPADFVERAQVFLRRGEVTVGLDSRPRVVTAFVTSASAPAYLCGDPGV